MYLQSRRVLVQHFFESVGIGALLLVIPVADCEIDNEDPVPSSSSIISSSSSSTVGGVSIGLGASKYKLALDKACGTSF